MNKTETNSAIGMYYYKCLRMQNQSHTTKTQLSHHIRNIRENINENLWQHRVLSEGIYSTLQCNM